MKKYLTLMLAALAATLATLSAQGVDYNLLARRADNFFNHGEWLNAAVTYERMLKLRPTVTASYGRGIVAASLADQPDMRLRLTHSAMEHGVVIDSLFNAVRGASFDTGHSNLYEDFIITSAHAYPWMSRMANIRLLDYYDYRSDGPAMTRYALRLLPASPNSVNLLTILARGYLLQGDTTHAVSVYNRILTLDPSNLTALLTLGNHYADTAAGSPADRDRALHYLTRANELAPTPYLARRIDALSAEDTTQNDRRNK